MTLLEKWDIQQARWYISNRKCLMIIRGSISDGIRMAIPECATATEYLAMVKSQFTDSSQAYAATLSEQLMTKKYAGGGIREYILEMSHMANKLKTMSMPLPDPFIVKLVSKSIPKNFSTFHVNQNTQPENRNVEKPFTMCSQKVDRLKAANGGELVFHDQQKNKNYQKNKKLFPSSINQKEFDKCVTIR